MPDHKTVERARADKRHGKAASTQAGNFVKEEIDHIREGKHGARNTKQAIAIGLSKARRAGVAVKPPATGKASAATRKKAERDIKAGSGKTTSRARASSESTSTRSRATARVLKQESSAAVSKPALSRQARSAAAKRSSSERAAAAKRGAATKGASGRSAAAKKAARTRATPAR
ncbi:DNA-binding protein [Ralstonia sp. 24A2]|uniref:DNA-binding protein n=1 Tax=Ralstonia sp. 24A2 TaxID=3447364 RepID=UPI003F6A2CCC